VLFWTGVATRADGAVLELGCGTGRVSWPLARSGVDLTGIDLSQPMLDRAVRQRPRSGRARHTHSPRFVRGDIRALPFGAARFAAVLAPYGILQSILSDRDLSAVLASVAHVLERGGTFGIDLVPDVPNWREYNNKVQLRGRASGGRHLTLVESVRQDRATRRTTFEQRYLELTFRTLTVRAMTARLARAGFAVEAVLGDYDGGPWDARADVWILLARRK
jgi:ubiquinone/menaquinone biosynthesis C-methylase UbiE